MCKSLEAKKNWKVQVFLPFWPLVTLTRSRLMGLCGDPNTLLSKGTWGLGVIL